VSQRRRPDSTREARSWLSVLVAASALLVTRMASADLPSIEWHAPRGCGTAAELTHGVGRLLRADTSYVIHERFVAEVEEESVGHFRLTLRGLSESGNWTRTLTGVNCLELRDAAKVMIALAIEPSRAAAIVGQTDAAEPPIRDPSEPTSPAEADATSQGSSSSETAQSQVASSSTPAAPAANAPPSPGGSQPLPFWLDPAQPTFAAATSPTRAAGVTTPPKTKGSGSAGGSSRAMALAPKDPLHAAPSTPASGTALLARIGVETGVLPSTTSVVALGAMQGIEHVQLTGYLGWLFPRTGNNGDPPSKNARVHLGFVAAEIGYAWLERAMELGVHAALQGGIMAAASSRRGDNEKSGVGPYGSLGAGVTIAYPATSRWAAMLFADGWVNCISPDFRFSDVRVYQSDPVGGAFGLGVRFRLK
jgi:hypothetical protein